jgi:flagellar basal body-associated protein FliL
MNKKLILIPVIALVVLGAAYKTVLAKPSKPAPKPKVDGSVYVLQKEFLVNLKDGRFAKLTAALVLAHDDTSTAPAGGHEAAASPPEGYGAMTQEAIVRAIVTDALTGRDAADLEDPRKRDRLRKEIVERIHEETDVHADDILFPDLTVQ